MIVVTSDKIPKEGLKLLETSGDETIIFNNSMTDEKRFTLMSKADAIISLLRDKFDEKILRKCQKLKVISNYAVGYDNIDINAAKRLGISVCNTPDVLTETTADLAFAIMLSAARNVCSSQRFLKEGKYHGWEPDLFLGYDIYGKTIGIIGAGKIGQAIAKRAMGFGMKILYYKRKRNDKFEILTSAEYVDVPEILRSSDFISLNTPLTTETYHLIGEKEFALMKRNAIIVNTSRGAVIDEYSLIGALKNKLIAGCALDVFEFEPDISNELLSLENVVLTPHIGSASFDTRKKMAIIAAKNVISVLNGEDCPNLVNR